VQVGWKCKRSFYSSGGSNVPAQFKLDRKGQFLFVVQNVYWETGNTLPNNHTLFAKSESVSLWSFFASWSAPY